MDDDSGAALDQYDTLGQIGCCFWKSARTLLDEDPKLRAPKYGGVSHAGPGFCPDSLYVRWGNAEATEADQDCTPQRRHEFLVDLGIPACSEFNIECPEPTSSCESSTNG